MTELEKETRHDNGKRDRYVVLLIMLVTFGLIFGFAIYALTQTNLPGEVPK